MTNHLSIKKIDTAKLKNLCKLFISDLTSYEIIDRNAQNFFWNSRMKPSDRIENITNGGSDGWEIFYKARKMMASGINVIELSIGEHDICNRPGHTQINA